MAKALENELAEISKRLRKPPAAKDALLKLFKQAAIVFSEVEQSPSENIISAVKPSMDLLVEKVLLEHKDKEVRLLLATCLSEVLRIVAPEAPYSDEVLNDVFLLIVSTFEELNEFESPFFTRRVHILELFASVRSCLVMLDLEMDDLILEMFQIFFSTAREQQPENVSKAMQDIMCLVIDESEKIPSELLDVLIKNLSRETKDLSPAAHNLASRVFELCSENLLPYVQNMLIELILEGKYLQSTIFVDIYSFFPEMLSPTIPSLIDQLRMDQVESRVKAVQLLGHLFSVPAMPVLPDFRQLWTEFLRRFTDKEVEVRLSVIECARACLIANPDRPEANEILDLLNDRLQDFENSVRIQVVAAICDFAMENPKNVPMDIIKRAAERLRDKKVSVREDTLRNLTELYKRFCLNESQGANIPDETFEWIPSKILRCCFDKGCKEFRPQRIELIFMDEIFPSELPAHERVKHWISFFSTFDANDEKALERIFFLKQRLQREMQNYVSLRQKAEEENDEDIWKKIQSCWKSILPSFVDPSIAEENFEKLNQLKDNTIFEHLSVLLDPNTPFLVSADLRKEILNRLGESHPVFEFMKVLATKCSYMLFGREHVKSILNQVSVFQEDGKLDLVKASMRLLLIVTRFFPSLVEGVEDKLFSLLKEGNEFTKETIVQVLAKAGGFIRDQFAEASGDKSAETSGSAALVLEKLCLEGTRKQAKYAAQALVGLVDDSGYNVLSALYGKLVDLLETSTFLPAILQSLSYVAQHAISVFESHEDEVVHFIVKNLLRRDGKQVEGNMEWNNSASEECTLKICGLKVLVKSYVPSKITHQRQRIKGLLGVLTKILESGEISDDIKSSDIDKSHLRLAAGKAVLRLSRRWDAQISSHLFHLTVLLAQDGFEQIRRDFLGKIHRLLKERRIPIKYACSFALNAGFSVADFSSEAKQFLCDFVEICRRDAQIYQAAATGDSDGSSIAYFPEYVLVYLIHVLAHRSPSLTSNGECTSFVTVAPIYKQLLVLLYALLNQSGEVQGMTPTNTASILSILYSIRHAEDAVDRLRSESSTVLCDISIMILKSLTGLESVLSDKVGTVILPVAFYKASSEVLQDITVKEGELQLPACLKDEDVLGQLQALQAELCLPAAELLNLNKASEDILSPVEVQVQTKHAKQKQQNGSLHTEIGINTSSDEKSEKMYTRGSKKGDSKRNNATEFDKGVVSSLKRKKAVATQVNQQVEEGLVSMNSLKRKRGRPKSIKKGIIPTEETVELQKHLMDDGGAEQSDKTDTSHESTAAGLLTKSPVKSTNRVEASEDILLPGLKKRKTSGRTVRLSAKTDTFDKLTAVGLLTKSTVKSLATRVKATEETLPDLEGVIEMRKTSGRPARSSSKTDTSHDSTVETLLPKGAVKSSVNGVEGSEEIVLPGLEKKSHMEGLMKIKKSPGRPRKSLAKIDTSHKSTGAALLTKSQVKSSGNTVEVTEGKKSDLKGKMEIKKTSRRAGRSSVKIATIYETTAAEMLIKSPVKSSGNRVETNEESLLPGLGKKSDLDGVTGIKRNPGRTGRSSARIDTSHESTVAGPLTKNPVKSTVGRVEISEETLLLGLEKKADSEGVVAIRKTSGRVGRSLAKIYTSQKSTADGLMTKGPVKKSDSEDVLAAEQSFALTGKAEYRRKRKNTSANERSSENLPELAAVEVNHGTPRRASLNGKGQHDDKKIENHDFDEHLVGLHIRVWWPLDKRFYEGVIESYDSIKKKHKVMYTDGDVEVLNLVKERWERLDVSLKENAGSQAKAVDASQNRQDELNSPRTTGKIKVKNTKTGHLGGKIPKGTDSRFAEGEVNDTALTDPASHSLDHTAAESSHASESEVKVDTTTVQESTGYSRRPRNSAGVKNSEKHQSLARSIGNKGLVIPDKSRELSTRLNSDDSDNAPLKTWKRRR